MYYNFRAIPSPLEFWSDGTNDFLVDADTENRKLIHATCTTASQKTVVGIIISCHANIWGNN